MDTYIPLIRLQLGRSLVFEALVSVGEEARYRCPDLKFRAVHRTPRSTVELITSADPSLTEAVSVRACLSIIHQGLDVMRNRTGCTHIS